MKRVSLILVPCLLVVVLAGLFLHPTFAHGAAASPTTYGKGWSVVPSPNLEHGIAYDSLNSIAAISANDVWTVGSAAVPGPKGSETNYGMTEHWDGTSWSIIPDVSPYDTQLTGVAAVATNDVWVVGQVDYPAYKAFIEHWNGTAWSKVANPAPKNNSLYAVAALSSTDVWAVGSLIEHWNGTAWSIVPNPSLPKLGYLQAVTAISSTDAWAVGYESVQKNVGGFTYQSVIEHWNGTNWTVVASPPVVDAALTGVSAVSTADVWAVGNNSYGGPPSFIEHWDGTQWTIVQIPPQDGLNAVSAVSANNVWAVGRSNDNGTKTLILHWNGTTWRTVSSPDPGSPYNMLYGVSQIPGTTQLWTVGYRSDNHDSLRTLIEYYC
jgi:hypothetical protein